jgi:hypothetical protein
MSSDRSSIRVDPSWKSLPRAGSISLMIAGLLLIVYALLTLYIGQLNTSFTGIAAVYAQLYWTGTRSFMIGLGLSVETIAVVLLIPAFAALYIVLSKLDRSYSLIGAALAASAILVFLSNVSESFNYVQEADLFNRCNDCQPIAATSAISTFAVNIANLLALVMLAVSIIMLSFVMLKSPYLKQAGYLGMISGIVPLGIGALIFVTPRDVALYFGPVIFILFAAWFAAVGLKLYRI